MLLFSHFSWVQLCVTLWTVARQAPLSMEFCSQEHWSGLPCPPPGDLPNPGIEPWSPVLQADSLPAELSGKPKNIGLGTLSLCQGIFLTQESNWGLLHCRQILYQLSYTWYWFTLKPHLPVILRCNVFCIQTTKQCKSVLLFCEVDKTSWIGWLYLDPFSLVT